MLGPAGTVFVDPTFGSRLVRVTDGATRPVRPNRSYRTPSAAAQNTWNVTSTYFYVVSTDGTIVPFAFDPLTLTASRLPADTTGEGGLILRFFGEPEFSFVDPTLLYGVYNGPGTNLRTVYQVQFLKRRLHADPRSQHRGPGPLGLRRRNDRERRRDRNDQRVLRRRRAGSALPHAGLRQRQSLVSQAAEHDGVNGQRGADQYPAELPPASRVDRQERTLRRPRDHRPGPSGAALRDAPLRVGPRHRYVHGAAVDRGQLQRPLRTWIRPDGQPGLLRLVGVGRGPVGSPRPVRAAGPARSDHPGADTEADFARRALVVEQRGRERQRSGARRGVSFRHQPHGVARLGRRDHRDLDRSGAGRLTARLAVRASPHRRTP